MQVRAAGQSRVSIIQLGAPATDEAMRDKTRQDKTISRQDAVCCACSWREERYQKAGRGEGRRGEERRGEDRAGLDRTRDDARRGEARRGGSGNERRRQHGSMGKDAADVEEEEAGGRGLAVAKVGEPARRRCWVPTAGNSTASANANAERKCNWGLAGISVSSENMKGEAPLGG